MLNRQYNPPFGGWPKRKDCSIVDGTEEAKSGWLDFRKDGRPVSGALSQFTIPANRTAIGYSVSLISPSRIILLVSLTVICDGFRTTAPMWAARQARGPSSESRQGMNPRDIGHEQRCRLWGFGCSGLSVSIGLRWHNSNLGAWS